MILKILKNHPNSKMILILNNIYVHVYINLATSHMLRVFCPLPVPELSLVTTDDTNGTSEIMDSIHVNVKIPTYKPALAQVIFEDESQLHKLAPMVYT